MPISNFPATVTMPVVDEPFPSILEFLVERFPRIHKDTWEERIRSGKVLDEDGCPVAFDTAYAPRKKLFYFREVEKEIPIPFQEEVIYRDQNLLVVDKPHFLPTTQGGRFVNESLIHRLREKTGILEIAPIHRIDRETAGLVMFSLNPEARAAYQLMFERRQVSKVYHAISPTVPDASRKEWQVDNRLVPGEPPFRIREGKGVPNASTRIVPVESKFGRTYFHLFPHTGKRHQLRFHMASLGFPIENDKYYPDLQDEVPDNYEKPLQLLAMELEFADPLSDGLRRFRSRRKLHW
jgi:tRNA pseudouridine32 synthase/23S rRNA pseudouridine746 synthase